MELEKKRIELSIMHPLGKGDERAPQEVAKAARRKTASVSEYVDIRERSFQRTVYEVLWLSGLSKETSALLAEQIFAAHREDWQSEEAQNTTQALRRRRIPVTPTLVDPRQLPAEPSELEQLPQLSGENSSLSVFRLNMERKIPRLKNG